MPGSSLSFSFTSADSPASVNGNSAFFPGMPTSTATVYPQGPFSDSGHQFVVTAAQAPAPTPPVTVTTIDIVKGKRQSVTEIVVGLSGPVEHGPGG